MSDWNATDYLRFADERTRPAADLLARVSLASVGSAIDLGCGPGNSTALIAARYPEAAITGVDDARDMLAEARRTLSSARFVESDLRAWRPETPPDLVFANAVLQWLPDHETLFARLAGLLAPGGCLAVQMPDNLDEPSHRLMRVIAAEGPWQDLIGDPSAVRSRIAAPEAYYDWLVRVGCSVEIWATRYQHPLDDVAAIVAWLKATGLRPFLAPLDPEMQAAFLGAYESKLAEAYPKRADGKVLLAFPRLFIVARRSA